jgi:hypothetical protein
MRRYKGATHRPLTEIEGNMQFRKSLKKNESELLTALLNKSEVDKHLSACRDNCHTSFLH